VRTIVAKLLRPWIVMPLVAVLAFGGWWVWIRDDGGSAAAATPTSQLVTATKGPMARTVSAEGTIAAAQTDDLSFSSAGTVTAVDVKAGQTVKAGDVVATIDSAELQSAVADAQSSVADAQAKLDDDQSSGASDAQIAADKSALTSAQDKLASAQTALAGAQLVATFDGTVAAVNISVGEQLGSGGTGGTDQSGSQSGSGNSAQAPGGSNDLNGRNGTNGTGSIGNGSNDSSSTTPDIQVISTSSFTIDLGFDDTDIGNIKVGQDATITLSSSSANANGRRFGGGNFPFGAIANGGGGPVFDFNGGTANATNNSGGRDQQPGNGSNTTGGAGSATRAGVASATGKVTDVGTIADASSGVATYPVTVAFADTSGGYHPGANATVEITYAQVPDAIQVPALAVTTTNGTSTVTVSANGKEQTHEVTTGLTSNGMVQITNGLQEGEQVVLRFPGAGALQQRFQGAGGR
jgi:multidrug efflux pump subunit AcrA (membrane-fusion protein)